MHTVYIESSIIRQPRAERIIRHLKPRQVIECDHYKEVFNPKNQNFRIQKNEPTLIIAAKHGKRVFESPPGFGIGSTQNYYFSHMLNCLYDCRYCFLQGMYSSANYVLFVNYEEFMQEIAMISTAATKPVYFFSGYDCDSLAYEPVSHFVKEFSPFFRELPNAFLELRTKSTNIKELLKQPAYSQCIVAFSFTPHEISIEVEHKVPTVAKRLAAMSQVAAHGWPIGIRLDPLIYHPDFKKLYEELIAAIFAEISADSIHSISIGALRFPEKMYRKLAKLYPKDPLLAQPLYRDGNMFSYRKEIEFAMKSSITTILANYIDETLLFECQL